MAGDPSMYTICQAETCPGRCLIALQSLLVECLVNYSKCWFGIVTNGVHIPENVVQSVRKEFVRYATCVHI